jgi:hypothetical protein
MKKITKNLFDLTPEQEQSSISIYGKVIKCLIAPYHSIKDIPLEPNDEVYVYPERDLNIQQRKEMVGIMANSAKKEIYFVTSDLFMILDMIDGCCRILTPDGEIEECPEKTFAANPHTIIYEVIHNEYYVKERKNKEMDFKNVIQKIIDDVNDKKGMTLEKYEKTKSTIKLIGEDLIRVKLLEMLSDVKIIPAEYHKNDFTGKVEFSKEEMDFLNELSWTKKNLSVKQCIEKSKEGLEITQKELKLYDEMLELMNSNRSKYKNELEENTKKKSAVENELKVRHKIDYWLSEQKESAKISDIVEKL